MTVRRILTIVALSLVVGLCICLAALFLTFPVWSTGWMNRASVDYTITFGDNTTMSGTLDPVVVIDYPSRAAFCVEPFTGTLEFRQRNSPPYMTALVDVASREVDASQARISRLILGTGDDTVYLSGSNAVAAGNDNTITRNWFLWRFAATIRGTVTATDGTEAVVSLTFEGRAQALTRTVGSPAITLFCYRTAR